MHTHHLESNFTGHGVVKQMSDRTMPYTHGQWVQRVPRNVAPEKKKKKPVYTYSLFALPRGALGEKVGDHSRQATKRGQVG